MVWARNVTDGAGNWGYFKMGQNFPNPYRDGQPLFHLVWKCLQMSHLNYGIYMEKVALSFVRVWVQRQNYKGDIESLGLAAAANLCINWKWKIRLIFEQCKMMSAAK